MQANPEFQRFLQINKISQAELANDATAKNILMKYIVWSSSKEISAPLKSGSSRGSIDKAPFFPPGCNPMLVLSQRLAARRQAAAA
jgi:hypothetical protein